MNRPPATEDDQVGRDTRASSPIDGGSTTLADEEGALVLPLAEEVARLVKHDTVAGRVRVSVHTDTIEDTVRGTLSGDVVEVVRVPVDRPVTGPAPQVRTEGDLTIVPVLEEVLVVERRLVLKEELHIRRHRTTEVVAEPVTLRRQVATVERSGPGATDKEPETPLP